MREESKQYSVPSFESSGLLRQKSRKDSMVRDVHTTIKSFTETVRDIVRKIPKGTVMTYKKVATTAGNEKASRAVANIMASNYDLDVPCHRVVCTDGSLGGYNRGGVKAKEKILKDEGVTLQNNKVIF